MPADAGAAQVFGRSRGLFKTLHPVDGALHERIETLHAEAGAVDAAERERVDHRLAKRARIDLDRDFGRRRHEEAIAGSRRSAPQRIRGT